MVCDDVKRFIYFFLDGELPSSKAADLRKHLDDCPGCGERVLIQQRLRTFLHVKIRRNVAPEGLRDRILQAVQSARMQA